jgi:hypothetical protein
MSEGATVPLPPPQNPEYLRGSLPRAPTIRLEFNKSRGKIVLSAAMQSEFKFDAGGHRCVAVRTDRHWGHGLDVNILGRDGHLLNVVTFACNPELPSFKTFQALSTEELVNSRPIN